MWSWLWPFKSSPKLCSCGQPRITKATTVIVWGFPVELTSSPQCKICTSLYLNQHSTYCEHCRTPICPGEYVTQGSAYSHYRHAEGCGSDLSVVGIWGESKLNHV